MKNAIVKLICPACQGHLIVEVSPAYPMHVYRDGSADPPEPAELVDVEGHILPCSLVDEDDDDRLYGLVMEELERQEHAAYDREMDSRIAREWGDERDYS